MTLLHALAPSRACLLLLAASRRPAAPLIQRILAAYRLDPDVRRVVALSLLHELVGLGSPSQDTLRCWSQIGCLLTYCAMSVEGERAEWFARLARNAHDLWEAALTEVSAQRPARRVIDAVCTEVAS